MNTIQLIFSVLFFVGSLVLMRVFYKKLIKDINEKEILSTKIYYIGLNIMVIFIFLISLMVNGVFGQYSLPQNIGGHMEHKQEFIEHDEEVVKPIVKQITSMGQKELEESKKILQDTSTN